MRVLPLSLVICLPLSVALAGQSVSEYVFDDAAAGETPPGLTFATFRQPEPGTWRIGREDDNGYLCHERDGERDRGRGYSLALFNGQAPADLMLTARVRLPEEGPRIGGLVWRYLDDEHYYSLVLDLGRQRLSLVRVSGGHYVQLDSEDDLELDPAEWHVLKITHVDGTVRASIGGVHVFDDEDRRMPWWDRNATQVGLVAGGSSRVDFDDVRFVGRGDAP